MRVQVCGGVVGGFAFGFALWACSAPSIAVGGASCDCTDDLAALEARLDALEATAGSGSGDEIAALEGRVANLEATSITQSGGEATIPASATVGEEGGQIILTPGSDYGTTYAIDSFQDYFRVLVTDADGSGGVALGYDPTVGEWVIYGDLTVEGTVTATAFAE